MKLQPDQSDVQVITGHGPGWIGVAGEKVSHSVVVGSSGERFEWAGTFEELGPEHFDKLAELNVEVVIFGSGSRIRFPKPAWIAGLASRRIGVETMDTAAACRTYNILAQEGRVVAAALIVERSS